MRTGDRSAYSQIVCAHGRKHEKSSSGAMQNKKHRKGGIFIARPLLSFRFTKPGMIC